MHKFDTILQKLDGLICKIPLQKLQKYIILYKTAGFETADALNKFSNGASSIWSKKEHHFYNLAH